MHPVPDVIATRARNQDVGVWVCWPRWEFKLRCRSPQKSIGKHGHTPRVFCFLCFFRRDAFDATFLSFSCPNLLSISQLELFAWKIIPALLLRKSLGPEFAYLNSMLMSTLIISPAAVIANKSPKYRPDTRTYERRMVPTGWRSVRGFVVAAQDLSFRVTAD